MNTSDTANAVLIEALVASALKAGAAILDIYHAGFDVVHKADASPVTAADHAAEAIILADLARAAPGVPIVAEEEVAAGRIPQVGACFYLVDPLDGTREFVERRGDFTVNIALIENNAPVLGVVYAPHRGRLFVGDVAAGTAWTADVASGVAGERRPIKVRAVPDEGLTVVASQSHGSATTEAYLAALPVAKRVSLGSSLKLCLVATGEADLYPRLSPTCEWDIAAGDAVLRAAGGMVFDVDGSPMRYAKPRFFNPGFVASGGYRTAAIADFTD